MALSIHSDNHLHKSLTDLVNLQVLDQEFGGAGEPGPAPGLVDGASRVLDGPVAAASSLDAVLRDHQLVREGNQVGLTNADCLRYLLGLDRKLCVFAQVENEGVGVFIADCLLVGDGDRDETSYLLTKLCSQQNQQLFLIANVLLGPLCGVFG